MDSIILAINASSLIIKSYHKDERSNMYIKCYEPCTLYTIVLSEVKALYPYFPFFQLVEQAIAKHNIKPGLRIRYI